MSPADQDPETLRQMMMDSPWRAQVKAIRAEALPAPPSTSLDRLLAGPVTRRLEMLAVQRDVLHLERWIAEWLVAESALSPEQPALTPEELRQAAVEFDAAIASGLGTTPANALDLDPYTLRIKGGGD